VNRNRWQCGETEIGVAKPDLAAVFYFLGAAAC